MSFTFIVIFLLLSLALIELAEISMLSTTKANVLATYGENTFTKKTLYLKDRATSFLLIMVMLDVLCNNFLTLTVVKAFPEFMASELHSMLITIALTMITTYLSMTIRVFVLSNAEGSAVFSSAIMYFIFRVLQPVGIAFQFLSNGTLTLLGMKPKTTDQATQRRELLHTLDFSEEDTVDPLEEISMLRSVLNLKDITIDQIMTNRSGFVKIEFSEDPLVVVERLTKLKLKKHAIVWEEEEDNIIGTLLSLDFLSTFVKNTVEKNNEKLKPRDFIKNIRCLRDTTDIYATLQQMRTTNTNLIFVVNEYGTIIGIVTFYDILGEIVGEEPEEFFQEVDSSYFVDGLYSIHNLNKKMDWDLPDEYLTVGGLLIFLAQGIPQKGAEIQYKEYKFVVEKALKHKIERVKISIAKE